MSNLEPIAFALGTTIFFGFGVFALTANGIFGHDVFGKWTGIVKTYVRNAQDWEFGGALQACDAAMLWIVPIVWLGFMFATVVGSGIVLYEPSKTCATAAVNDSNFKTQGYQTYAYTNAVVWTAAVLVMYVLKRFDQSYRLKKIDGEDKKGGMSAEFPGKAAQYPFSIMDRDANDLGKTPDGNSMWLFKNEYETEKPQFSIQQWYVTKSGLKLGALMRHTIWMNLSLAIFVNLCWEFGAFSESKPEVGTIQGYSYVNFTAYLLLFLCISYDMWINNTRAYHVFVVHKGLYGGEVDGALVGYATDTTLVFAFSALALGTLTQYYQSYGALAIYAVLCVGLSLTLAYWHGTSAYWWEFFAICSALYWTVANFFYFTCPLNDGRPELLMLTTFGSGNAFPPNVATPNPNLQTFTWNDVKGFEYTTAVVAIFFLTVYIVGEIVRAAGGESLKIKCRRVTG
jgi:hypothetical protein